MTKLLPPLFRMRHKRVNLHWVTDDIAIARQPADSDWPGIREAGIRCVVDLRAEGPENATIVEPHKLCYFRAPIREGGATSIEELQLTTGWIVKHLGEHGPVLVHCREGRGRSPMIVVASLVKLGLPLHEAYRITARGQPAVAINEEQQEALEQFARKHGSLRELGT